jgi:hypothetical protein
MRALIVGFVLMLATAAHAACPTGHALATVAETAFPAEMRGDAKLDAATCTAVRAHAGARWLLELDTGTTGLLIAVASPNGKVAWVCCGVGGGAIVDATATDLDGDGADELVITTRDTSNARAIGVQSIDGNHGDSIELAAGARWHLDDHAIASTANAGRTGSPKAMPSEIVVADAAGNVARYRWVHAALEHS